MKKLSMLLFVIMFVSFSTASGAPSQEGQAVVVQKPGTGFWLRVNLGGSPLATMTSAADDKISGAAGAFVLSIGAFLSDRFTLYGEIIGDSIIGPELTSGGFTYSGDEDLSATMAGIGIGVGYYLVPRSVFAGISVSMATMRMEHKTLRLEANTNPGIGVGFQLGKDFRISRKVLLGIAGHAFLATMKDKGNGPQWNASAFGITAALTYAPRGWTAQ
jgi:hypothetical protein